MSADFFFGVVIGFILLLVAVAALVIWGKGHAHSHGERVLALMRERNRLDEDKIAVLKGMGGWLGELVEVLKDAALVENLPPSEGLAARAVVGSEVSPSGGFSGGGDVLSEEQVRVMLGMLMRRYGALPGTTLPVGAAPGALFSAVMDLEAQREVLS